MKAVVTRVNEASVRIDGEKVGEIQEGFLVLLGVAPGDGEKQARKLADKVCALRVFEDGCGKMNRSLADVGGALLVVSQFTLLADCRRGNRPSFAGAAGPDTARPLYEKFIACCREHGFSVQHGVFGADMQVSSVNDGPVTLLLDTDFL